MGYREVCRGTCRGRGRCIEEDVWGTGRCIEVDVGVQGGV